MAILKTIIISLFFFSQLAIAEELSLSKKPEVMQFIKQVSQAHQIPQAELIAILNKAVIQQSIINAINTPKESKPWYIYRQGFLTKARLKNGLAFWKEHEDTLERAEIEFGVPASIIVAIIGVETDYGKHQGNYRVLDALATLAFEYPPRAAFFQKELETFLVLSHQHILDPMTLKGSYAGAFGQPQFMPSSYQSYAVDYSGLNVKDITLSSVDAIGSVGNYFKQHGWKSGTPAAIQARYVGNRYFQVASSTHHKPALEQFKPTLTAKDLVEYRIKPIQPLPANEKTALIRLETPKKPEYWLGLNNFYTILLYNPSANYAMAVYQLSQELEQAHHQKTNLL